MLTIRLPKEIEERLDRLAKATGRTKSYYVRQAIIERLEALEDIYIAEKRLEDIKLGKAKPVILERLLKRYSIQPC